MNLSKRLLAIVLVLTTLTAMFAALGPIFVTGDFNSKSTLFGGDMSSKLKVSFPKSLKFLSQFLSHVLSHSSSHSSLFSSFHSFLHSSSHSSSHLYKSLYYLEL